MQKVKLLAMTAIAGLVCSSCSYFQVQAARPDWRPPQPLHCTATYGWPATDGLAALGFAAAGVGSLFIPSDAGTERDHTESDPLVNTKYLLPAAAAALVAVIYGASAVTGAREVAACREAQRRELGLGGYETEQEPGQMPRDRAPGPIAVPM